MSGLDDFFDDGLHELRVDSCYQRRQHGELQANPDCRDPDHPGCDRCDDHDDHDDEDLQDNE